MINTPDSTIATPATQTRKNVGKQFAALKHKNQLLTILVLLFICVIGWAVVSLFSSQKESQIDPALVKLSKPITPSLNMDTLNSLENKRVFSDEELADFPIYRIYIDPRTREEQIIPIDQPLPSATPRVVATPSPTTQPTPAAVQ